MSISEIYKLFISSSGISIDSRVIVKNNLFLGIKGPTFNGNKFAEEAMYKWLTHAILSGKASATEGQIARLKRERFAALRNAKIRLSNLKSEELAQIMRNKSKWIKR